MPASVLFCCSRNAVRSAMAEALAKHLYRHRIYIDSVGVQTGETDTFAVATREELGIDISRHRPKSFDELEDTSFELVITLSPEAHHRAMEMTRTNAFEVEYWPTRDPTATEGNRETVLAAFRAVRDDLFGRIRERFGPPGPAAP